MSDAAFRSVLAAMAADPGFAARVRLDAVAALARFDLTDHERQRLGALSPEAHGDGVEELGERLSKSALFMPMGEGHAGASATEHGSLAGHMGTHQAADSGLDAFVESQAGLGDDDAE